MTSPFLGKPFPISLVNRGPPKRVLAHVLVLAVLSLVIGMFPVAAQVLAPQTEPFQAVGLAPQAAYADDYCGFTCVLKGIGGSAKQAGEACVYGPCNGERVRPAPPPRCDFLCQLGNDYQREMSRPRQSGGGNLGPDGQCGPIDVMAGRC